MTSVKGNDEKITALIQARMGSNRLPGKVCLPLVQDRTVLTVLIERLQRSKLVDQIVVATGPETKNAKIINLAKQLGVESYTGSEENVLSRFYHAASEYKSDVVVRITADCPLIDATLVDELLLKFFISRPDYLSNISPPSFPDGLDIEIFSFSCLKKTYQNAVSDFDKEHVTPYMRTSKQFRVENVRNSEDYSDLRWTIDEQIDLEHVREIFEKHGDGIHLSWEEALTVVQKFNLYSNQNISRNEGSEMSKGQKIWRRAKQVIPGGNMLLSKRPEMFLPDQWPAYFESARGCCLQDLDGKDFVDMSLMGVGTNILGYSHAEVDEAVLIAVQKGNMSTLNCAEEVYLAEKLISMHPWSAMARFARSGGEANSIAIRIARAASGRPGVAFCGYHGWHDWYLAANHNSEDALDSHLLSGLSPEGVPKSLKNTSFPFRYGDMDALEEIVRNNDIGVIKMEVVRDKDANPHFLNEVRLLANRENIVLVFDECTSGFRETFGGIHKKYEVEPDIAMFGKALGNGYAVTAILGKKHVMECAQKTFISSTFWTERIGSVAALKTLEVMEREKTWNKITNLGIYLRRKLTFACDKNDLPIYFSGIPALTRFSFGTERELLYKSLITKNMLSQGYLASNMVYLSAAHSEEIIDKYVEAISPTLRLIKEAETGVEIEHLIEGKICHSGFERLN